RLLGGIAGVIDRGRRVVRHIRDVHDAAVQRRRGDVGEGFLVHLLAGDVFAGVDVDIAHAGEDQAALAKDVCRVAKMDTDGGDDAAVDGDLAVPHAVDIGQGSFDDWHDGVPG